MAKGVEAIVEPALLVWARESAGFSVEEAARKVGVKPKRLQSWESGEKRPTLKQLRKLGKAYKRPIAVFYLLEPPKDFRPMNDFRRLSGQISFVESPQLRLEIRRARDRREIAIELYEQLGDEPPRFDVAANFSDDPERLGVELRKLLGIARKDQIRLQNDYEAFSLWRSALEGIGVLVFQAVDVDLYEMRGFSISEKPLPVAVVNIKDSPRGRIFTMLHEFTHIVLSDGGICDLEEEADGMPEERRVEVYCNRVAGAILVPRHELLHEDIVLRKEGDVIWTDEEIIELANKYQVSREALLRRLLICGRTTQDFYQKKRDEFRKKYEKPKKYQGGGFAPPYRMAISTAGPSFVRLVLHSYYQDKITTSDLCDFLNVKLQHMGKIESEIIGHRNKLGI